MQVIDWAEVRNQKFTMSEARDACDFADIVHNFGQTADEVFDMYSFEDMKLGTRLFFAENLSPEQLHPLYRREKERKDRDQRILNVIDERMKNEGILVL